MKSTNRRWKKYFQDTTHKTIFLGPFFIRTLPLSRKSAIEKEFYAQKWLSTTGLVPKPYFKYISNGTKVRSFIVEKTLFFNPVYKKTNKFITSAGRTLRELHDCSKNKSADILKFIPPDSLLKNGVYSPTTILKVFITNPLRKIKISNPELLTSTVNKNINIITGRVKFLSRHTKYKSEYNVLIHGDLNETNVVRNKNGRISYLDWADCRWDVATCDISQFIYLHRLNNKEKRMFLKAYGANWVTDEMVEIHRLLLIGWDIIYLMTLGLNIPKDKITRLLPMKERIWNMQKIII